MGQDFHSVKLGIVRFLDHVSLKASSPLLEQLLLFLKILHRLIDVPHLNLSSAKLRSLGTTLNHFSKITHLTI